MTSPKRHHFTPRYYLKRFENCDGKIWRFDKKNNAIVKGDHMSFGVKKHWNRLQNPPEGFDPLWAETRLAEIDGHASKVIERLANGDLSVDLTALSYAMSFMQHHQPHLKNSVQLSHSDAVSEWTDDWFLIVLMKTALQEAKNYVPRSYSILQIPDEKKGTRFLTSSNPVVEFNNKSTMFFPLTKNHCLIMFNEDRYDFIKPSFRTVEKAEIKGINALILKNSWQYTYSSTESFDP